MTSYVYLIEIILMNVSNIAILKNSLYAVLKLAFMRMNCILLPATIGCHDEQK